jgi:hypothetical protein
VDGSAGSGDGALEEDPPEGDGPGASARGSGASNGDADASDGSSGSSDSGARTSSARSLVGGVLVIPRSGGRTLISSSWNMAATRPVPHRGHGVGCSVSDATMLAVRNRSHSGHFEGGTDTTSGGSTGRRA